MGERSSFVTDKPTTDFQTTYIYYNNDNKIQHIICFGIPDYYLLLTTGDLLNVYQQ